MVIGDVMLHVIHTVPLPESQPLPILQPYSHLELYITVIQAYPRPQSLAHEARGAVWALWSSVDLVVEAWVCSLAGLLGYASKAIFGGATSPDFRTKNS